MSSDARYTQVTDRHSDQDTTTTTWHHGPALPFSSSRPASRQWHGHRSKPTATSAAVELWGTGRVWVTYVYQACSPPRYSRSSSPGGCPFRPPWERLACRRLGLASDIPRTPASCLPAGYCTYHSRLRRTWWRPGRGRGRSQDRTPHSVATRTGHAAASPWDPASDDDLTVEYHGPATATCSFGGSVSSTSARPRGSRGLHRHGSGVDGAPALVVVCLGATRRQGRRPGAAARRAAGHPLRSCSITAGPTHWSDGEYSRALSLPHRDCGHGATAESGSALNPSQRPASTATARGP
ncbi:hypothetical protein C8Q77DRAFT_118681 [Trametes polyzona]|nr:hypothetical protein C8Q77DRAFT_118681 [Trametes polyzona]